MCYLINGQAVALFPAWICCVKDACEDSCVSFGEHAHLFISPGVYLEMVLLDQGADECGWIWAFFT